MRKLIIATTLVFAAAAPAFAATPAWVKLGDASKVYQEKCEKGYASETACLALESVMDSALSEEIAQ